MNDLTTYQPQDNRRNTTLPENATDALVIEIWLKTHRSEKTREAYQLDISDLLRFTNGKPLQKMTLLDLMDFEDSLMQEGLKPASIARKLSAVKSLLTFCQKSGYTLVNIGAPLKPPPVEVKLAERIMSENQMLNMLLLAEENPRNHAMIRLMYNSGVRVSEVCRLTWKDLQANQKGGQIRVYGKGSKERYILISLETYKELQTLRGDALEDTPMFPSQKGNGFLSRMQVKRIVENAAIKAKIATYTETDKDGKEVTRSKVSPHWVRHAHASHAIDRKAPVTLVRDTLGHASIATTNKYAHAKPDQSSGEYLPI